MPGDFSPLHRRLPDTTVYELLGRLAPDELLGTLVAQVRTLWRSNCSLLWGCRAESLPSTASRSVRSTTTPTGGGSGTRATTTARRILRALRAVLTSSVGRPALAASHPAAHQRDGLFCGDVRRAAHLPRCAV